ncbi:unnamed protein product, partial [Mesorhabditis spiculigera]
MSVATKRRFVQNKCDTEYLELKEGDKIARICESRGNNLHEVEDENGDIYLASMPAKFRRTVWVLRDQFVVLQPIEEGDKVKAEIEHVLDEDNILNMWEQKLWPARFESYAVLITRDSKRAAATTTNEGESSNWIDDDMLPPSDDSESEASGASGSAEEEENSDEDAEPSSASMPRYNPNRQNDPGHK